MGSCVDQIIHGNHMQVSNHMWTRVSNHVWTIFDHVWVFTWSLSLITCDTIHDVKTNHVSKCLQTMCQITHDFKTMCDLHSNHVWLKKSNHTWHCVKSCMILNHVWLSCVVLKQITCKIMCHSNHMWNHVRSITHNQIMHAWHHSWFITWSPTPVHQITFTCHVLL